MNRLLLRLLLLMLLTLPPSTGWSAPLTGEGLFKALGCRGCHLVAGRGGSLGPALDGLGGKFSPEQLRRILTTGRDGSAMPTYDHLTGAELATLLDYLKSL